MTRILTFSFLCLLLVLLSCKKNQENLIPKEIGENIYMISSDLQGILYSQALLDRFAFQNFSDAADCLNVSSDTLAGKVTHTILFQKSDYCDFYQDSTKGKITMSYNLNYGSVMDTILLNYENFRSNGHYYNGTIKVFLTSFLNSNAYDFKVIVDDLIVTKKNESYSLEGNFTRSYYDKSYHTNGELFAQLEGEKIQAKIKETLVSDGDYSFYNYLFNNYFDSGILEIPLLEHSYSVHFGVNSSYSDKAICIDETGYRYIIDLSIL